MSWYGMHAKHQVTIPRGSCKLCQYRANVYVSGGPEFEFTCSRCGLKWPVNELNLVREYYENFARNKERLLRR